MKDIINILANDEILSMENFAIKGILDEDSQEDLYNEQEKSIKIIEVEDPCKKWAHAKYKKDNFKEIVQLLDKYYKEIERVLGEIKEKNSEEYENNSQKIICTLVTKILNKFIKQRKLGRMIEREENEPLSCTYNKEAKNDKEYCFVLIEMLKRFGFKVCDEQGDNASLGYIGFKDNINMNRDFYVCLVKIDGDWYALNRNGFIIESSIKDDEGYNGILKSDQDRIGYLCTKFNKSTSIAKEGLKQEMITRDGFTYMDSIKINIISSKENASLRNLTNVDFKPLEEENEEQKTHQVRDKRLVQKHELRRKKDIERIYTYSQNSIKSNDRTIKKYIQQIDFIERIENAIANIDGKIKRLEIMKEAKKYGYTDSIDDRIERLQERKEYLMKRLPEESKEFYEQEVARLKLENEKNSSNVEEYKDEDEAWRKERVDKRRKQLSRLFEGTPIGKLNITNPIDIVKTRIYNQERE